VRKADINNGFSAIVYIDGDMEDYLISNVVKDIDGKNQSTKNMSLLLFSKNEKNEVEAILEKTSPSDLVKYIRANFEKKDSAKQLFWFPQGAEGEKLALEVS
jgi:predicted adenine nucleotide alpha hydrolase (AANH) superfamily ATPase